MTNFEVRCNHPGCSFKETSPSMSMASSLGQIHAMKSGHKDIDLEGIKEADD